MTTSRRALTTATVLALLAGGTTGALASGRDHPEDDGTTTGTTTTGTTTTGTGTTPRAPRIVEGEVDDAPGGRVVLRAEVQARGARVTSVRFRYRGTTYRARRSGTTWSRAVTARGGDALDDAVVRFRITACAGARCTVRTVRDDA